VRSTDDGQHVLVALNLTAHAVQREVELPGGRWRVRFNSDARRYSQLFGDHATPDLDVTDGTGLLDLGPYSCVVYLPEG
jgi:1,4-alpha-glucan branching enzyme